MSKTKKLIISLILTIILFTYNNCRFVDEPVSIMAFSGGNGEGYDGKPDPGTYYRQVFGALCDSSDILAQLKVTEDNVELIKKAFFSCYESTTKILFDHLEHYRNFKEVIGYEGGIYLNSENYEKGFVPELWCRSEDLNVPRHHLFLYNPKTKELKTKWVTEQAEYQDTTTSRTVVAHSATYENANFKLGVDLSTEVIKGNKNYAASVFDKNTQKSTYLSCISGSNTLPENKVFEIPFDFYSFNLSPIISKKGYAMYRHIKYYDDSNNNIAYVKVLDLNLGRIAYNFSSSQNDDYSLIRADFSGDGKFLNLFWHSNTDESENKLEIINLENNNKNVIALGEFYPVHSSKVEAHLRGGFGGENYVSFVANTSSGTWDKNLVLINRKTGEITNVDTLNLVNSGRRHKLLINDSYMFYIKANYKDDWQNYSYNDQVRNYSLVIYNLETKEKKITLFDSSQKFTFSYLPNSETPILSSYDNKAQSKIFMFDEVSGSFKELDIGLDIPVIGGIEKIFKLSNSKDFYLLVRSSNTAIVLLKLNFDVKKIFREHLINELSYYIYGLKAAFNPYSNTLMYQYASYGASGTHIIDLNNGYPIGTFDFDDLMRLKFLKENFVGVKSYTVEEYDNDWDFVRTTVKYSIITFEKQSERWVRNVVLDGLKEEPTIYQNAGNIIYFEKDLTANEYKIKSINVLKNEVAELFSLSSWNYEIRNMDISPDEKFIYLHTTYREISKSGSFTSRESRTLMIRAPGT